MTNYYFFLFFYYRGFLLLFCHFLLQICLLPHLKLVLPLGIQFVQDFITHFVLFFWQELLPRIMTKEEKIITQK